jgi:hypothetical protein
MSTTINLNRTFEIELEDNTTLDVLVMVEVRTEDNDFQASRQIKTVTYDNVLDPLEDALTELLSAIDEDEDPESQEQKVIDHFLQRDEDPQDSIE